MAVTFKAALGTVLICASTLAGGASATPPAGFDEYQMKAAFLVKFAMFVEWPGAKGADRGPIVLGTLGPNPFGAQLETLAKGQRINGREIQVRHFDSLQSARAAHVLFIAKGAAKGYGDIAAALDMDLAGVLTVGEPTAFSEKGGIVTFLLDGDRLAFEIDMDEAERAGLKVSAQLQKLARAVRRR